MTHAGVGVGVLIVRSGTLLLQKRTGSHGAGTWSSPGGHIDLGETPEQTAIRETMEEVGLTIERARLVTITNDINEPEQKHYITLWFVAEGIGSEEIQLNPRESTDYGWFALDALPSPLFVPLKNLVEGRMLLPFDLRTIL